MIEGTLYRIVWCHTWIRSKGVLMGAERVSYLFECSGRRSTNATTWYHGPHTHFRFLFNAEGPPVWLSVFVQSVEEVSINE